MDSLTIESIACAADPDASYNCTLDLLHLSQLHPDLLESLLTGPKPVLHELSAALPAAQQQFLAQRRAEEAAECSIKSDVHIRLLPLPATPDTARGLLQPQLSQLRTRHNQRLVTVTGAVVRTGQVNVLESHRLYECKRCQHR